MYIYIYSFEQIESYSMGCNTSEISIFFSVKLGVLTERTFKYSICWTVCIYIYMHRCKLYAGEQWTLRMELVQVCGEYSICGFCLYIYRFFSWFCSTWKGVGANLKQVYKSTSRLLLHVELVEWSKEYSKCEFYLCICMVSFVGMHHLDRTHWNKQSTQWKNKTGKPLKE